MNDDDILFLPDDEPGAALPAAAWPVMVVDDDPAVHEGTRFALSGYSLDGAGLELVSAYSAAEARTVLAGRRGMTEGGMVGGGMAVILLDVVMETDDAGLRLVDFVRRELKDDTVRIILRTGQPGQAPERRVIVDYDINDYKAKTELTADKLFTSLTAALRAYQQLKRLEETRRGLEIIIDAAPMLLDYKSMQRLAEGVLTQVGSLLNVACEGILVLRDHTGPQDAVSVLAGSGCYQHLAGRDGQQPLDADVRDIVARAFTERRHTFGEQWSTLYVHTASGSEIVALLKADRSLSETDRGLIALFTSRLSVAFDNVFLYEQLQRANIGLEQRVVERTGELMRANRRLAMQRSDLRRANQLKTEILGTVAHDLKNPLSVILGRAEMLGDMIEARPQPAEAMHAQIGHIRETARRLTGMIETLIADAMNDALDIVLRREAVDFAALAREVSLANAPLAETKGQTLRSEIPGSLTLHGDAERLREAMDNLISNAIKYSPAGAEIVVTVVQDATETAYAVRDQGPGLSPEDTARLFGRFQRLSAKPTAGEGSTGLGLSIVKRIAELHGGRATAESHEGEVGSTFAIRLPNGAGEVV